LPSIFGVSRACSQYKITARAMFSIPIYENRAYRTHLLSLYVSIYAMNFLSFVWSAYSFADHNEWTSENTIYESRDHGKRLYKIFENT